MDAFESLDFLKHFHIKSSFFKIENILLKIEGLESIIIKISAQ